MVTKMKEIYREKLLENNEWIDGTDKYGLILTDDIDSLLSCAILKSVKNWDIEQIFLFKANGTHDYLGRTENATHEAIGVDFARKTGKCFDNHLTAMDAFDTSNPESINLNRICNIHREIYTKKYNLSTVLLLWSLYNLPKENLSDELMMLLLGIDSSYYSYFHGFQKENRKWLVDVLDLPEFYDCQKRHKEYEFLDIQKKYKLKSKITIKKGVLQTDIDVEGINDLLGWECDVQMELPTDKFFLDGVFKDIEFNIINRATTIKKLENAYCYALTRKNLIKFSERIIEECDTLTQKAS